MEEGPNSLKQCLEDYTRATGYELSIRKKDKVLALVKCHFHTECLFKLNVRRNNKEGTWGISHKSSCVDHNCDITTHPRGAARPATISSLLIDDFKASNKLPTISDIKTKCQQQNLKFSKRVGYSARALVINKVFGV